MIAGRDRIDLAAALESLNQSVGAKTVRVDSGGTLNGVLLRAGLDDEVSLLIHPRLVGGISPRSIFRAPDSESDEDVIPLALVHLEKLDGGVVWARYVLTSGRGGGS
jgi:2,5-diamino-6-(ribosylamino)-4(3H)-pyrimidinone 5'-phosphate reductase